ncbi:MAG: hypothetical protein GWP13_01250 [Planctomycetia bacterium]|nr:hypothetical protein [Planctomycetia bacterium]
MFFKRLLTIWFLLFTLNSSVAWAFSDHPAGEHGVAQASDTGDGHPSPLQDSGSCDDHCSHSSAHVVALISTTAALKSESGSVVFYFYQRIPGSLDLVPPFQPPIS